MTKFYYQNGNTITPLITATSRHHAERLVDEHHCIVETDDDVYLNPLSGAVVFESSCSSLEGLCKAKFDSDTDSWVTG